MILPFLFVILGLEVENKLEDPTLTFRKAIFWLIVSQANTV